MLSAARRSRWFALVAALFAVLVACGCSKGADDYARELGHADPFRRTLAALALSRMAPERAPECLDVLLEGVDRVELGLATELGEALDALAPRQPEPFLVALLSDPLMTAERRAAIRRALVRAGPPVVPSVLASVRGSSTPDLEQQLDLLVAMGAAPVPELIAVLAGDGEARMWLFSAEVLARVGRPAEPALPALRARASAIRREAPGDPQGARLALALEDACARIEASPR